MPLRGYYISYVSTYILITYLSWYLRTYSKIKILSAYLQSLPVEDIRTDIFICNVWVISLRCFTVIPNKKNMFKIVILLLLVFKLTESSESIQLPYCPKVVKPNSPHGLTHPILLNVKRIRNKEGNICHNSTYFLID